MFSIAARAFSVSKTMTHRGTMTSMIRSMKMSSTTTESSTNIDFKAADVAIRPALDDVERISKGQAAARRGTGSRAVPHRLNASERKEWDLAKKRRYLMVRGTGWRKERGDSPLVNIYRLLCDSLGIPSISCKRGLSSGGGSGGGGGVGSGSENDEVIVDLSPLRRTDLSDLVQSIKNEASSADKYASLDSLVDNSNVFAQGWDSDEIIRALKEDAIWRIPIISVSATFRNRSDAKRFAQVISKKYAGGIDVKESKKNKFNDNDNDGDDNDDDDE